MERVIAAAAARERKLCSAPRTGHCRGRRRNADSTIRQKLPTVFSYGSNVVAGGLLSYRPKWKTCPGAKAGSCIEPALSRTGGMPIEQATTFEMVVNLKTAQILGIEIPALIVAQANQVIE